MDNINLKIYWVTTVWPKWQVIIPKECRCVFWVGIWSEFKVAMVDKSAFWIWIKEYLEKKIEKEIWKNFKLIEDFWDICIWTKFQFVIPAIIRKELWIKPWENLIVLGKCRESLWFIKNDKIEYLLDYIKDVTKNK